MEQIENRISSREVAEMMGREHKNVLKKIDGLNKDLTSLTLSPLKYWCEGSYFDYKGEKRLWDKLRDWGMIFKNSTEPKQMFIDRGYFEVVEGVRTTRDKTFTYHTTRVTGKGQTYIINRLLKEA